MSDLNNQDLEIKLAFLERHIEEQDKVILSIRNELVGIRRELKRMNEQLQNPSGSSQDSLPHQKPPHY